jgi:hypothetical protein
MANRALTAPTPSLMIPRRTLLKAAGLAAAATVIRPAFTDSELDSLYAKARKEGGLNLYGGGPADWYTQWAKQFEVAFPDVPITFNGGSSNELSPNIDKQIADKKAGMRRHRSANAAGFRALEACPVLARAEYIPTGQTRRFSADIRSSLLREKPIAR